MERWSEPRSAPITIFAGCRLPCPSASVSRSFRSPSFLSCPHLCSAPLCSDGLTDSVTDAPHSGGYPQSLARLGHKYNTEFGLGDCDRLRHAGSLSLSFCAGFISRSGSRFMSVWVGRPRQPRVFASHPMLPRCINCAACLTCAKVSRVVMKSTCSQVLCYVMNFQEASDEVLSNTTNATCHFNPFPTPFILIVRLAKICSAI